MKSTNKIHIVLFCGSLCILIARVMFTRFHSFEYNGGLILCFKNSTFGVIMSSSGRIGSLADHRQWTRVHLL